MGHVKTSVQDHGGTQQLNTWRKAAYLTVTLNEHAAYFLHSIPTVAIYTELTAVLENRYADDHLEETFHAQLRSVQHPGKICKNLLPSLTT